MKFEKFKKEIIKDLEDIIKEWEDGEAYEGFTITGRETLAFRRGEG